MNILVINWQDKTNPFAGGAETHLHEIFGRIAAMGHSVTLLACGFESASREEILETASGKIRVLRVGSRSLFNFYVPSTLRKLLRSEKIDIVIDDINKIPFYLPLFITKKPILAIAHHFFGSSIFREAGLIAGLYVSVAEYLVNFVYKQTSFAVVSQSTLDEYLERGFPKKNFSIIPNAITPEQYPMRVGKKNPTPMITYFGRLKKYKSVDHALRAFAAVRSALPEGAEFHLVGKGEYEKQLRDLAAELQIPDNALHFWGFVTDGQKIDILSRSWCVVNTSMKEGWGITNIEANACGTPVLAANSPGLRDSVRHGESGLLYSYGNVSELAEAMRHICNNAHVREHLSRGAVRWAESFSWDESARLMLELCERVVHSSQGKK